MSYHNSTIELSADGKSAVQKFHSEEVEPSVVDPEEVELVEVPEEQKPPTLAELRKQAKSLGVAADIANSLKHDELVDAIERLTHSGD